MLKWCMSIIGVVFLGVLFDLIYPNGKTNTLCKSIFGIFALFVMISPILNFDISNYTLDNQNNKYLVENINIAKINAHEIKIVNHLNQCGFKGVDVEIDSMIEDGVNNIENIYVDITNLVLSENMENINKYEVIADRVNEISNVGLERIVIYG